MVTVKAHATNEPSGRLLGSRLRDARVKAGLSLRELARRVGVSPSFMSQVERDKAAPSVGTLFNMVSELGLTIDSVMGDTPESPANPAPRIQASQPEFVQPEKGAVTPERQDSMSNVKFLPETGRLPGLQRADERPEIHLGGVRWERLTPSDDPVVEFLRVTYVAGSESCPEDNLMTHGGKEYFHVLSGRLDVQVAFNRQTLGPGDSVNFDSSIPHRLSNSYDEECVAVWIVVGR